MSIGILDAASAYARSLKSLPSILPEMPAKPLDAPAPSETSFGSMVQSLVDDTGDSLRAAETASAKQVAGKGDLVDVVTAIGAAETALDTVVAVRDKVVSAYNEIIHMQI